MAQALPAGAQKDHKGNAMDLGTILNVLFDMMLVPCVALLAYGGWLAWGESAYQEESARASRLYRNASAASREAAIPARPSGALLWDRPSTRRAAGNLPRSRRSAERDLRAA